MNGMKPKFGLKKKKPKLNTQHCKFPKTNALKNTT